MTTGIAGPEEAQIGMRKESLELLTEKRNQNIEVVVSIRFGGGVRLGKYPTMFLSTWIASNTSRIGSRSGRLHKVTQLLRSGATTTVRVRRFRSAVASGGTVPRPTTRVNFEG